MKLIGPVTEVIDLRGRSVIPGLADNHFHSIGGGLGGRSRSSAINGRLAGQDRREGE